ncbi:MAG TPA: hypothetical protein VHF89_03225, partial [Solirubrobacteraceae bacterium]|nr:hypothetical protein [Solirubrobacteraceae bacterium]
DWPDVGFSFRPYSTGSEPEVRALGAALQEIDGRKSVDAAVDLHGMLTADALSFTLIGHGRHDWAKDTRIRETAKNIHLVSEKVLAWSPLIVPNNTPKSSMGCTSAVVAEACRQIYGQTWGTVYDTINYTVTGSMGDWMDSPFGLGAVGLNNEMAFSHLDRNIVFEPQGEQLHVDGNKALIYAQITSLLNPPEQRYTAPGLKGYVANTRKTREEEQLQEEPPRGTVAQAKITGENGSPGIGSVIFEFPVKIGRQPADDGTPDAGKDVFNGGMRVDITKLNAQGISDGNAVTTLKVQCRNCDDHPGIAPDDDGFITVAEDFNQSAGYAQAGLTVAVNRPMAVNTEGEPVEWRAVLESTIPQLLDNGAAMDVEFFQGPATLSRDTSGFNPPSLAGYDVANTDLFEDLNGNIDDPNAKFRRISPALVAQGRQKLDDFTSIVLSDLTPGRDAFLDALQGWVRDGGNLVLTDSAVQLLPEYVDLARDKIQSRLMYVPQISFQTAAGQVAADIKHPLAVRPYDVRAPGARFGSGLRRQTYEPTPLGFAINHAVETDDNSVGDDYEGSPVWEVNREAFEQNAGAKTAATAAEGAPRSPTPRLDRTTVGEAVVGEGRVRFIGAVVPQPSQEFDHDFGIEPYSLTYTGHFLLRNALEWPARPISGDGGAGGPGGGPGGGDSGGGPVACTASNRGFRSVSVRGAGRRKLRIGFERRVRAPITVDVFQTSAGRRVFQERLVARFRGKFTSFTWNDRRARRNRKVRDGYYFVRLRMVLGSNKADYRRVTLRRRNGRWHRRPPHYRKESCSLLTSYKLLRPVFGGRDGRAVAASYRLTRRARAGLTIMRGTRVVRRVRMRVRRADITYRHKLSSRGLRRGDYRFILRVRPIGGGRTVRSVLTSRRI